MVRPIRFADREFVVSVKLAPRLLRVGRGQGGRVVRMGVLTFVTATLFVLIPATFLLVVCMGAIDRNSWFRLGFAF